MKERPILFSGSMVRALLNGSKTQTRRLIKPSPPAAFWDHKGYELLCHPDGSMRFYFRDTGALAAYAPKVLCPYGAPGDRLWVKETFFHQDDFHGEDCTWYRADHDTFPGMWKPSIFCRRAYSRITLEIVCVRVERLNDISSDDCLGEGISASDAGLGSDAAWRLASQRLWESINSAGSWALNPWVWVIEFRKL